MIVLDFGVGVWCLSNLIILKIKMSNCLTGDLTANDSGRILNLEVY